MKQKDDIEYHKNLLKQRENQKTKDNIQKVKSEIFSKTPVSIDNDVFEKILNSEYTEDVKRYYINNILRQINFRTEFDENILSLL